MSWWISQPASQKMLALPPEGVPTKTHSMVPLGVSGTDRKVFYRKQRSNKIPPENSKHGSPRLHQRHLGPSSLLLSPGPIQLDPESLLQPCWDSLISGQASQRIRLFQAHNRACLPHIGVMAFVTLGPQFFSGEEKKQRQICWFMLLFIFMR